MSVYTLQWSITRLEQLPSERYAQFFLLVSNGELVFVGKAYREDLAQLIPACLRQLNLDPLSLTVYLGRIREIGLGRISGALVDTMLGMLVFAKKPRHNTMGKYRYQGMLDLELTNVCCEVLPAKLRAEKNCVIVGPQPARTTANPLLAC